MISAKFMHKVLFLTFTLLTILLNTTFAIAQFSILEMENPLVGKKALEFNLSTLSGEKISLTQYRAGKSAIIFFWATWCPNCHEKMIELSKAATELKTKGMQVILVDIEENIKTVKSYIDRNHVPYDVFLDDESKVAEDYGIIGVPTLFFVGKDGIIKSVEHSIPKNYQEILMK